LTHYSRYGTVLERKGTFVAKEDKIKFPRPPDKYRRVEVSSLYRGRRGKHFQLVQGIIKELQSLEPGSALEIPLDDVNGIGLANLRSAVHRGATAAGLAIETLAHEKKFYVWKRLPAQ
jgi:hypothetical protein